MKFLSIFTKEYYNHPEFYRFMPASVFNALEEAELKGALLGKEIEAEVPEDDFLKMLNDLTEYEKNLTNGS